MIAWILSHGCQSGVFSLYPHCQFDGCCAADRRVKAERTLHRPMTPVAENTRWVTSGRTGRASVEIRGDLYASRRPIRWRWPRVTVQFHRVSEFVNISSREKMKLLWHDSVSIGDIQEKFAEKETAYLHDYSSLSAISVSWIKNVTLILIYYRAKHIVRSPVLLRESCLSVCNVGGLWSCRLKFFGIISWLVSLGVRSLQTPTSWMCYGSASKGTPKILAGNPGIGIGYRNSGFRHTKALIFQTETRQR